MNWQHSQLWFGVKKNQVAAKLNGPGSGLRHQSKKVNSQLCCHEWGDRIGDYVSVASQTQSSNFHFGQVIARSNGLLITCNAKSSTLRELFLKECIHGWCEGFIPYNQ